uniref:CSON006565 protein n=1 Tax=Culicoides sonorensis TaxID=179676 RepID=A0A336LC37_CULSO
MFFNFFKRSKTRNSSKNEKECANEKQTLPDSGNVDSARKKFSFPKGTHTNNQNCGSTDKHLALSQLEKTNHCANSLVGALHLNQIPVPTSSCSSSYSESIDDDTTKNKNINREIHYDKIPSVSPQQEKKQQYLNDNYLDRKQNDLTSNVVEVNVYKKNNNNNSSKGDRQKNDSNSKISTNADSYDATTLDGARLNEPVSKFSPKLFAFREKRGDKSQNNSSGTSFFNDLIMGKGRQRNRHQQKPQAQQQQQKNKQSQVQAHGSGVNGPKKNNNNVKNLPQNTPTNIEKCNKNQGDTKINVSKRENLPQEQQNNNQRGVVKNNIVHENDVNHGCVSECSPNDVNTTTLKENSDQETSHNDENASPFIHLPSNEQQGAATKLNLSRENSNEFTPPEKKTKLSETVNGELCEENIVAIENLRENHQENCGEKQTDEMGQPNSKNGVNNNESNANYNSTTSDVTIETVSNNNNNSNHIQENLNQDEMGTDETIGGVQEQREISPSGSNITKTVRFNDENLCSYADDIFYEANDNSNLQSYISLENLSQLPNDELNNSNSDRDISDNNKNNKVPLVQCEDDEFDLINDNDDDDDDEIPSTYEEAQSISILVKDDEFCENIVQPPTNNLTKENHENEINEKNNFNSAFNDDHDHDKNNEENLIKITQKNNETSIYAINSLENTENQLSNDENQIKIETEEKNCENIHSFENTSDESEENSLNTNLNNNKNLYMEDTISLPDIIESSHHTGINGLGDELKIDEKPDKIAHEMRDLVNQESRYNVQLEAAEEKALAAQQKVNELKAQIYNLEREISNKGGVQERLQAELEAANKDSEQTI